MVKTAFLLVVAAILAASEVRLELPAQIAPGVPTDGMVVVSDAQAQAQQVEFPELPGVTWELGSGSSRKISIINGVASSSERIPIVITATQPGALTIAGLAVVLRDGSRLVAAERTAQVAAGSVELNGDAQFTVGFGSETAWVGQAVTMEFRAAMRNESIRIEKPGISPPSQATVLETQPMTADSLLTSDGSRWRTETWRWSVCFTTPGTVEVRGQQEYYHCRPVFDRWVPTGAARRAAVKPATLTVREIPSAGRPADWTGVVGEVRVEAALDRERITAGEGARLTITIHGPQAAQLARPALAEVPGLRAYPHADSPAGEPDRRSFTWDLVPAAAGRYGLPAPSVPWFDPATERFARAEGRPLTLEVLPGRSQGLSVAGDLTSASTGVGASPIALSLPAPWRGNGPRATAPLMVLATLVGALAVGLALGWRSVRAPRASRSHRGRALAAALRANDLPAAALALQALRPALTSAAHQASAQRLDEGIARARFGGGSLRPDDPDLAALAGIP